MLLLDEAITLLPSEEISRSIIFELNEVNPLGLGQVSAPPF